MLRSIFRDAVKVTARCRRYSTCWCPLEPIDPSTEITYLTNGVRIATEENCSPLACVSLFVAAGPRYETANCNGITHFIEHMAFKGFKTMPRKTLEETVRRMGAKLTVKTTRELQIFTMLLPAKHATDAIEYLSKIIFELELDEQEIEKECYNLCLEMQDADYSPKATVFDYLHATAFQGTPLAQPVIGPTRNVCRFDKSTLCTFLCEHYTTYRLLLATSGGVSHNGIVEKAMSTFGCLAPFGAWSPDLGGCRFTGSQVIYRNDSMPFAHVAIAVEGPGYASPDYLGMLVMKCMIGSWHKSQGRPSMQPFSTAQGAAALDACVSYKSFYITYRDVGLWGVYFVGDKHKLDEMVTLIQYAWMDMTVTVHAKEVEKAVNIAKKKILRRYEGVMNSCRDVGTQMIYNCTRRPLSVLLTQLDAINFYNVRALGERYIYSRSPAVVAVGPTEALPVYNRIESQMYWLRW